jgi:hypothetical protein
MTTTTTRKPKTTTKVTAEGLLNWGSDYPVTTTVRTTVHPDGVAGKFTATEMRQGALAATAYNAVTGSGTHVSAVAHGVTAVSIRRNLTDTGVQIIIRTESGQDLHVDLFSPAMVEGREVKVTTDLAIEVVPCDRMVP